MPKTRTLTSERDPLMSLKHTILIVDDESSYVESVRELLRAKYRVLGTTDPLEALRILEEQEVHIVLADQRMPGMSGLELLRLVRDKHPSVIRLITSSLFGPEGLRTWCHVGKNEEDLFHYVVKVGAEDLIIAIQQAVEEYELRADQR
jgi:PleD family two-component response regulator